jgi:glycosyltransferase involved in cell wall biosynthesis
MKILTLNYEYPPLGGGAGLITQHICKGLHNLGHSVTIITAGINTNTGKSNEDGLEIIRLPSRRKLEYKSDVSEMLSWIKHAKEKALDYCSAVKPDICFSHFALPGGEVARFLKKNTGIPYVIMSHGHDIPWFDPKQMFFYHLSTYCRIKKIYNNSSALFIQSAFTKQNADSFSGKKNSNKNIVIPNGCDTNNFPVVSHNKDSTLNIFTGGRMVGQKETVTLLRALVILKSKDIHFHLTIAGDGPLLSSLKKFCTKHELNDVVTFTGWLKKSDIPKLLERADVFVLPSRAEGMSISLLEALCSGVYAIVSPVSGNSDVVVEDVNGRFFPLKDHNALAKALEDFNTKRMEAYPVKNDDIERFRIQHNWANIAILYEKQLQKILS